ncbi:MAG: hypothetical protein GXO14_00715 [Thermococci archaeon]|nr:hypothetical protein [Thermococci archaeon]
MIRFSVPTNDTAGLISRLFSNPTLNVTMRMELSSPLRWFGLVRIMNLRHGILASKRTGVSSHLSSGSIGYMVASGPSNRSMPGAGPGPGSCPGGSHQVRSSSRGKLKILDWGWLVNDRRVTEVSSGTKVTAYVIVEAYDGNVESYLEMAVRKDIKGWIDSYARDWKFHVNIPDGHDLMLILHFTAKSGWHVRGYYISLCKPGACCNDFIPISPRENLTSAPGNHTKAGLWCPLSPSEMVNKYPPRLKVR